MKMKKLVPILALVLGLSAFSGCTNTDQKIAFGEYWKLNALTPNDQFKETLVYDVAFEANATNATDYTLDYKGTYTTNLATVIQNGETTYVYETALAVTATYNFKGVKSEHQDVVLSKVQFRGATGALVPIRSEKYVKSTSPTTGSHVNVTQCFQEFHYTVVNDYAAKTSVVTDCDKDGKALPATAETKNFTFEDSDKYNVIDNEQLFIALRAVPDTVTTGSLLCYSPFANLTQKIDFTFAAAEGAKLPFIDGTEKQINYRPVTITLDQKNPGTSQTAWIATMVNSHNNSNHNVLLRLETPIAYDLGTMVYSLKTASY